MILPADRHARARTHVRGSIEKSEITRLVRATTSFPPKRQDMAQMKRGSRATHQTSCLLPLPFISLSTSMSASISTFCHIRVYTHLYVCVSVGVGAIWTVQGIRLGKFQQIAHPRTVFRTDAPTTTLVAGPSKFNER